MVGSRIMRVALRPTARSGKSSARVEKRLWMAVGGSRRWWGWKDEGPSLDGAARDLGRAERIELERAVGGSRRMAAQVKLPTSSHPRAALSPSTRLQSTMFAARRSAARAAQASRAAVARQSRRAASHDAHHHHHAADAHHGPKEEHFSVRPSYPPPSAPGTTPTPFSPHTSSHAPPPIAAGTHMK